MTALTFGSLFTGVRGLDLAVERVTGAQPAWFCETEPGPAEILATEAPSVPNLGDVTKVDWPALPAVDILCGGFPCQDISNAGNRAGIQKGTRSGLWHSYAAAIEHLRPSYVFVENSASIRNRNRGLDVVLRSLADLGYDARWGCLRASDVGAPHQRNRFWLIATDAHRGHLPQLDVGTPSGFQAPQWDDALGRRLDHGWTGTRYEAHLAFWAKIIGRPPPLAYNEEGRLRPELSEWMMGYREGWVTDHLSRIPAHKAVGNGVCPQQAVAAYTMLLSRIRQETKTAA